MQTIAFFASANNAYIPKAVMALRSFQRFHPDCGYFILATKATLSRESLDFVSRYGIEVLDVDEAHRFVKQGKTKNNYPPECFYIFKGPELLVEHGFTYSISIDGDVFCSRPLQLDSMFNNVVGFAARPVETLGTTLGRTFGHIKTEQNEALKVSFEVVCDTLGLHEDLLNARYEVNTGVVLWNNNAMRDLGLFEKASIVFDQCHGYFESDQDLLAVTAASNNLPFFELDLSLNYNDFEDYSEVQRTSCTLRPIPYEEEGEIVYIVHFVHQKPWHPGCCTSAEQVHFINAWREFVVDELGELASEYYDDLHLIQFNSFTNIVRCVIQRIRSTIT